MNVAEQLVQQLVDAGVRRIYGIVGDSLNPIVDAVRKSGGSAKGGIDWVHVRHEEAAAFAAAAEAQLTGELAVCAGSCGPGNLHLINGLYDAYRSQAPVLALASHIPSVQIGSSYFQETHPDRLFVECSSYCEMVSSPDQAPRVVNSAIRHAVAMQSVSVITLPGDISDQKATAPTPVYVPSRRPVLAPHPEAGKQLVPRLHATRKVA
ncbi:MAG: ubiquinone-dependent pyruvate dehydrogenase, partial [Acidipropionibacterium jensenii]|uniref:thiamine pyrophosphate-binding protein n=1 Tax=Acidipropionibacterium jensenii TaxID=1749 RepID=UPI0026491E4D